MQSVPPVVLTVAGSDSGGGAGIQADLKTITLLGGFGTSAIAALTAQNGAEVRGIHETPPEFVTLQISTVLDGFPVKAAKTGMLASAQIIAAVATRLASTEFPLVIDPVCISQSGYPLLQKDALDNLITLLLPRADLVTPNIPEAEALTGLPVNTEADVKQAITCFLQMGAKAVLIKGGHAREQSDVMTDWLGLADGQVLALRHARVETSNNHGTGCTLSAAIATYLGLGETLEQAVIKAQDFLVKALASAYAPGLGAGPPDVFSGARAVKGW